MLLIHDLQMIPPVAGLTDDRLMYIGDRLAMEWRTLGLLLKMTNNYMDIVEMETKGQEDSVAFNMLKTWRDEENGKVDQLFDALQKMGKNELAMMVVPKGRIEITKGDEDEGGEAAEMEEVVELEDEEAVEDATAAAAARSSRKRNSMMATVPQLPPIAAC